MLTRDARSSVDDRCVADLAALRIGPGHDRMVRSGGKSWRSIAITVGANRSASRASRPDAGAPPILPPNSARSSMRLSAPAYNVGTVLGELGLHRSDLDDPDTLIPCAVTGALFERAQLMRPLKNLWTRLAAETPVGTFPSSTI